MYETIRVVEAATLDGSYFVGHNSIASCFMRVAVHMIGLALGVDQAVVDSPLILPSAYLGWGYLLDLLRQR